MNPGRSRLPSKSAAKGGRKVASERKTRAASPRKRGISWVLYVVRCRDGSLYCGITNHLARRLEQHNAGRGARYTRGRGPVELVRSWPAVDRVAAMRAECAFKALRKAAKEQKLASRSRTDKIARLLKGWQASGAVG